jgi:hypothetical protein
VHSCAFKVYSWTWPYDVCKPSVTIVSVTVVITCSFLFRARFSDHLTNGSEQLLDCSTLLHKCDHPWGLRSVRMPSCQLALLIVH